LKEKVLFIIVMFIFGSIGLFVKNIDLPSSEVALFRGMIGSSVLLLASLIMKKKFDLKRNKLNLILLVISAGALGFNWIFLFEAYHYTTISTATISYYFAPVIVMFLSPFVLRERWSWYKGASIIIALLGLIFITKPLENFGGMDSNHWIGIGYGLLAALLYASVILLNKFIHGFSGFERTVLQLFIASLIMLPYVMLTEGIHLFDLDGKSFLFLLIVGVIHTGLAYMIYFSLLPKIQGQTVAVYSYLDPITAVLLATLILREPLGIMDMIGGIFILGATFFHEIKDWKDLTKSSMKENGKS